jgi:hypothetical protein
MRGLDKDFLLLKMIMDTRDTRVCEFPYKFLVV